MFRNLLQIVFFAILLIASKAHADCNVSNHLCRFHDLNNYAEGYQGDLQFHHRPGVQVTNIANTPTGLYFFYEWQDNSAGYKADIDGEALLPSFGFNSDTSQIVSTGPFNVTDNSAFGGLDTNVNSFASVANYDQFRHVNTFRDQITFNSNQATAVHSADANGIAPIQNARPCPVASANSSCEFIHISGNIPNAVYLLSAVNYDIMNLPDPSTPSLRIWAQVNQGAVGDPNRVLGDVYYLDHATEISQPINNVGETSGILRVGFQKRDVDHASGVEGLSGRITGALKNPEQAYDRAKRWMVNLENRRKTNIDLDALYSDNHQRARMELEEDGLHRVRTYYSEKKRGRLKYADVRTERVGRYANRVVQDTYADKWENLLYDELTAARGKLQNLETVTAATGLNFRRNVYQGTNFVRTEANLDNLNDTVRNFIVTRHGNSLDGMPADRINMIVDSSLNDLSKLYKARKDSHFIPDSNSKFVSWVSNQKTGQMYPVLDHGAGIVDKAYYGLLLTGGVIEGLPKASKQVGVGAGKNIMTGNVYITQYTTSGFESIGVGTANYLKNKYDGRDTSLINEVESRFIVTQKRYEDLYQDLKPQNRGEIAGDRLAIGLGVLNATKAITTIAKNTPKFLKQIPDKLKSFKPKATKGTEIPLINGRKPINSKYAGQTHPSGVKFKENGFPDFTPFSKAQVDIKGLTGNYAKDAALANKAVGLKRTPNGFVWHHVENAKTMQLIPKSIHDAARHTGGAAILRNK